MEETVKYENHSLNKYNEESTVEPRRTKDKAIRTNIDVDSQACRKY